MGATGAQGVEVKDETLYRIVRTRFRSKFKVPSPKDVKIASMSPTRRGFAPRT